MLALSVATAWCIQPVIHCVGKGQHWALLSTNDMPRCCMATKLTSIVSPLPACLPAVKFGNFFDDVAFHVGVASPGVGSHDHCVVIS